MPFIQTPIKLDDVIKPTLIRIAQLLNRHGFECYLVGGSVRDLILRREVYDYDLATNAHPDSIRSIFKRSIPTGIKHGTITVIEDGITFEITTYRADGTYLDGRHPESIAFSDTLEEDIRRRDFTINGIAYNPLTDQLIDHVRGIEDIERKVIQTIGNPSDRFNEDGLRPLRACRFASKLHFTIEEATFNAISLSLETVGKISLERVRDEFMKILETDKPSVGIELLRESGILKIFIPELSDCYGVLQNKYHKYDVYYHSIYSCDAAPIDMPLIRLAALLHDIGKVPSRRLNDSGEYTFYNHEVIGSKLVKRVLRRLKFSNEQIEKIDNLVLHHMFHYTDEWTDGAVRRFIRKIGINNIDDIFSLRLADRKGNGARKGLPTPIEKLKVRIEKVISAENAISVKDLDIDGTILMSELNLLPGPMIGEILRELLELVLDNPDLNKCEILLEHSKNIFINKTGQSDTY
jgi:tRNA nucleotidyltransferase (CCA-adding enzyme)